MVLEALPLNNYRLHKSTDLQFSNKLNYILGGNGQGKTTILEAIYSLCTTKNLSQANDSEVVNFEEKFFEVKGTFKELTEHKIRLFYDAAVNKKSYFIDSKQIYKASSVIGEFPLVTLTPSDHAITQGAPSERRKFVDSVISQASHTYLDILLDYKKTLKQRSSLLSQIKESRSSELLKQLDVWTETLVKNGVELVKHRYSFVREFNSYVINSYKEIMNNEERPLIVYNFLGSDEEENIEERFYEELNRVKDIELIRAKNLVGPHRDDFVFYIDDIELRKFGSQGQHKTFEIALRFGQFFYMKDKLGRKPIFLMDDIFGELDTNRAYQISKYLKQIGQAFITMTDFSRLEKIDMDEKDLKVNVNKGEAAYA
jgi:DNA replication and repair protein RecF